MLPERYSDVRPIAAGGMGEIYLATDEALGRQVVVKVLAERFARDEASRKRFMREALAAARLSGEAHVVTIFDVGEHEERPFIVMEYLDGGSLAEQTQHGPVPPRRALTWLEEAAAALDAAHAAGVVHRDVKPANLLLDASDHVHVADFGIASAAGLDSLTQTGTVLGTAGYLSPEQAGGQRATDASDRYALAVVAFELLAGRRPFEAETAPVEAAAHLHAPVPSVHQANPSLPRELDTVFERALAKEPSARYGSAAEFVADLQAALHEAAGATRVLRAKEPSAGRWIPVVFGALLAAAVAVAILVTRGSKHAATPTQVVTVTRPVSTRAAAPSGSELNDAGYRKMRAGDYRGALPLLEQAVHQLQGNSEVTEAYADYNLAYTRFALGRCDGVLDLLARSEAVQGHRKEIDELRKRVQKKCGKK